MFEIRSPHRALYLRFDICITCFFLVCFIWPLTRLVWFSREASPKTVKIYKELWRYQWLGTWYEWDKYGQVISQSQRCTCRKPRRANGCEVWPNCEILASESPQMLKSQIFTVFFAWPVCYQSETCSPGKGKWLGPGALMANRFNRLRVVCALTLHRSVVPLPVWIIKLLKCHVFLFFPLWGIENYSKHGEFGVNHGRFCSAPAIKF